MSRPRWLRDDAVLGGGAARAHDIGGGSMALRRDLRTMTAVADALVADVSRLLPGLRTPLPESVTIRAYRG